MVIVQSALSVGKEVQTYRLTQNNWVTGLKRGLYQAFIRQLFFVWQEVSCKCRRWSEKASAKSQTLYARIKEVHVHCYCASLVRTLFIGHARATSCISSARTESKTQQNVELMTFALTWCANIFVGCSDTGVRDLEVAFLRLIVPDLMTIVVKIYQIGLYMLC